MYGLFCLGYLVITSMVLEADVGIHSQMYALS